MLYQTHKKFAQLFGVAGLATAFSSAIIPTFDWSYGMADNILVGTLMLVGYSASTFGGEFPDIDSATSVPARRYPFMRNLFTLFGVKHRGKFSHDYVSIGLLFGTILFGAMMLFKFFWDNWLVMLGLTLYITYFFGREIGNELVFKYVRRDEKRKRYRMPFIIGSALGVGLALLLMGWFPISSNPASLLRVTSALKPITYTTIVFAWVGAYSHLFADMLTNEGVNIFWIKISPARWVMRLNKIPFLVPVLFTGVGYLLGNYIGASTGIVLGVFLQYMIAKTDLKTGSPYEKVVRRFVKILLIPMIILLVYTAFGGVLS